MKQGHHLSRAGENARFAAMLLAVVACFLMGGASRNDVTSLMILEPLLALCGAALLILPGSMNWQPVRAPLLFLAALAALTAAQLIPLPPAIWTALPGHGQFAASAHAAGMPQPWRPISLTPDQTLASLMGLLPPFAVLTGMAGEDPARPGRIMTVLLAGSLASALFGLAQTAGGSQSPFYLYAITNDQSPVGLFSNRNHQAAFIAMTWPLLAGWAVSPARDPKFASVRRWVALAFALFLLPLLLVTGSRAGLVLGPLGLVLAMLILRRAPRQATASGRAKMIAAAVAGGAALLVLVATVVLSRAEALSRLFSMSGSEDTRAQALPTLLRIAREFFPVGTGFGSFDAIYRVYEPASLLEPEYLNHAHNDALELLITAGLPGVLLAVLFVGWVAVKSLSAWKSATSRGSSAQTGAAMILIALLASVLDYPLRTPLMMVIVAIASVWLSAIKGRASASATAGEMPLPDATLQLARVHS